MKKFLSALSALALIIGISTSCQKETSVPNDDNQKAAFTITATISAGDTKVSYAEDESTHALKPAWTEGDIIIGFDGTGGTYGFSATGINDGVATFTLITEGEYAGTVTEAPGDGTKLYMIYAPGKKPSDISDKSLAVSIASQGEDVIPALMMAGGTVSGGGLLLSFVNKTAVICIKHPNMAAADTLYTSISLYGTGMNTEVMFDLNGEDFRATYQTPGVITKAINYMSTPDKLIPTDIYIVSCPLATAADLTFTANIGEKFTKPARTVEAGNYYYMTAPTFEASLPENALRGLFTVNAAGKQVRFSKGNLWADASVSPVVWSFETKQYNPKDQTSYQASHVSHFFWSDKGDYGSGADREVTTSQSIDWGVPYCASNGLAPGTWHTLSGGFSGEWDYLLTKRTGASDKVGFGTVCGVKGIIIIPDEFTDPMKNNNNRSFVPMSSTSPKSSFADNDYKNDGHWDKMEAAGAVFLPAAGWRKGEGNVIWDSGAIGEYWSGDYYDNTKSCELYFTNGGIQPLSNLQISCGGCVRLVTTAR